MNAAVTKTRKKVEKRIVWTTKERAVLLAYIASKLVEMYAKVPPLDKISSVIIELANEAQKAKIASDRQRKITGLANLNWGEGFEEMYSAALQKALDARDSSKAPAVPPAAENAVQSLPGSFQDACLQELMGSKFGQNFVKGLVSSFKEQALAQARRELEVELGLKPSAPQRSVVVQERPQGDELPVIVLAGWEVPEFEKIRDEVAGRVTLKHVPLGSTIDKFEACKTAACTLVPSKMKSTQFIGKVRATTDRWEKIDGNLKSIRKVIESKLAA